MTGVRLTTPTRRNRTIADMKILNLIHLTFAQAFYRWALREINPLHPDVPRILLKQQELSDRARLLG